MAFISTGVALRRSSWQPGPHYIASESMDALRCGLLYAQVRGVQGVGGPGVGGLGGLGAPRPTYVGVQSPHVNVISVCKCKAA